MEVSKTGLKFIKDISDKKPTKKEITEAEKEVTIYLNFYRLRQVEFDALVSFVLGSGNMSLLTKNGRRNKGQVADSILLQIKVNGKVSADLVKRRKAEYSLFCSMV